MKRQNILKRILFAKKGSAAIEMAILIPVFITIIIYFFDLSVVLIRKTVLSHALNVIKEKVIIEPSIDEHEIKEFILSNTFGLIDRNKLTVTKKLWDSIEDTTQSGQRSKVYQIDAKIK